MAAAEETSSAEALAAGAVTVYGDALASGWVDWSWSATRNFANTSPVAAGTNSIAVTLQAWGGLSLHDNAGSISGMNSLVLSVNGGSASTDLNVFATSGGTAGTVVALAQYCAGKAIPVNAWTKCSIPFLALGMYGKAVDGFGLRDPAGAARATFYVDDAGFVPPAPAAPTGLTATATSSGISLAWTAVSGATGYDVFRATSSGGTFARLTKVPQAGTTYADTAVTAGATYWYRVVASNAGGGGPSSAIVSATASAATTTPAVPAAPAGLSAAAATGRISLAWNAVSGATGYDVYRATTSGGTFAKLTSAPQAGTTYADAAVAAGSTYWYQVSAVNAAGSSAASNTVSATVPATAPAVAVTIAPATATLDACKALKLTATVSGATDTSVTWSVQEGSVGGTVDSSGNYTAPNAAGTFHVVATSKAAPTATATVPVVVQERVLSVAVVPLTASLSLGGSKQFAATVTTTCGTFAAQ